ncbi:sialidase family protein [Bacteroides caecigallinarum]|uniref:sialidase family protein n=1 Tax=Bacteroides caecigallinarum TaxID=1411144 RepID=UPI00195CEB5B|nr:sialidase family protein [Bacteroides caecigallinarum]MBM6884178.1 exo-alpha-sialidase [Bacteroides caecigallinarum]
MKIKSILFLFSLLLGSSVVNASTNNGITDITVDQGFLTAGKGNNDHVLLRINLKRDLQKEAPLLSGIKVSLYGTTDLEDISSLKVYATQTPFLNGAIKAYSLLLADSSVPSSAKSESFEIHFSSDYIPLKGVNYLWLTADISSGAKVGNKIDALCEGLLLKDGTLMTLESGNPEGIACIYDRQTMLFNPWDHGSEYYRIPAMIVLENNAEHKGRIITVTDRRYDNNEDLPNKIDLVARYSDDNGNSWSTPKTIAGEYIDSLNNQGPDYGYGDAAIVETTDGKIICLMAADRRYQRSTYDDRIKVYQTSSDDGGKTWERPKEISDLIYDAPYKDASAKLQGVFVTSGKGLCLKHQKRKSANGRIMFAMVCKFSEWPYYNYIVYSDDNGKTWNVSKNAVFEGGDEAKLVEERDGTVIISTRRSGERGFNVSHDGGLTWGKGYTNKDLWGNSCNADMLVYSDDVYLHTMPNAEDRRNLTIYASKDKGKTWPYKYVFNSLPGAYSSIVKCADGSIGIYYEDGTMSDHYSMNFITIPLEWILTQV